MDSGATVVGTLHLPDKAGPHPATLRARLDIDADQVVLFGISQAGWVLPMAAAMSRGDVAFMIVVSGPTVSIAEENHYSDLTGSTAGQPTGRSRDEIRRLMAEAQPGGIAANAFIAELTMPALWIYGALDQSIPWEEKHRGHRDREGGVGIAISRFGYSRTRTTVCGRPGPVASGERPTPTEPVDGYFEAMETWLFGHAGAVVPG